MKQLFLIAALFLASAGHAADHPVFTQLLAQDQAPPGVVFEIVTADPAGLDWAVPQVADYAKRLRERFPKLEIAVVTHGQEMFALQTTRRADSPEAHAGIEQLVKQQNIPVHVCETYAGWRGIRSEAFPPYVNVAPVGPTQVKLYLELGYVLIKISSASNGDPVP
jgi:intracellular sulfur oxidation DsrE/DsrF family protein